MLGPISKIFLEHPQIQELLQEFPEEAQRALQSLTKKAIKEKLSEITITTLADLIKKIKEEAAKRTENEVSKAVAIKIAEEEILKHGGNPEIWKVVWSDTNGGRTYFWNKETNETYWKFPEVIVPGPPPEPEPEPEQSVTEITKKFFANATKAAGKKKSSSPKLNGMRVRYRKKRGGPILGPVEITKTTNSSWLKAKTESGKIISIRHGLVIWDAKVPSSPSALAKSTSAAQVLMSLSNIAGPAWDL